MDKNTHVLNFTEEKQGKYMRGGVALAIALLIALVSIILIAVGITFADEIYLMSIPIIVGFIALIVDFFMLIGFIIIKPNEAAIMTFFGKYVGTIDAQGLFFVNPFNVKKKVSIKARTLINEKQKVNDELGNPIEIGIIVIWRVKNPAQAVFVVEDYEEFISTQTDGSIRHVARQYPYDISNSGGEDTISLRGSSEEIGAVLLKELSERVSIAGIEIMEARIAHLAYAPEIAAAMLQRQQAAAIIAARKMIVEGAVGMVHMALEKLKEENIIELDAEKKATMVSNLLVVLCGDRAAQPIINTGSIY